MWRNLPTKDKARADTPRDVKRDNAIKRQVRYIFEGLQRFASSRAALPQFLQ